MFIPNMNTVLSHNNIIQSGGIHQFKFITKTLKDLFIYKS